MKVVITGGTSGIGKALVRKFVAQGDDVFVLARSIENSTQNQILRNEWIEEKKIADKNEATEIDNALENLNKVNVLGIKCDIANKEEIQKAFALVREKFGEVDILVNNAGYGVSGATELVSESECRKIFDVNFFGSLFCMQEALPMMKSGSKIVNISSACAIFALPFRTLYCASKAATSMLSHSIRLELKNSGIEVFAICPGDIKTNFTKNRVKNFQTNIRYGDRIEKATNKIDSREDKRMTLDFASSKIFKIIMKKKHKAQYIIGAKYKALYFAQKIFPINLVLNATNKLMG